MAVSVGTSIASSGLPTPNGTPQQTPGRSTRDSQYDMSSPLPFLSNQNARDDDGAKEPDDEDISPYDPRRFTPNLHASLVAEILSLRREIESKNNLVGNLEETLHSKETENDQLNQSLNDQTREAKNVRRQMQMLESGTLSALDDMAKERETAVQSLADARKRLENSKDKVRSQEEDAKRMNNLWDLDRRTWENEKRAMETRLHVAEGRLKTVISEVASIHTNGTTQSEYMPDDDRGMRDTWYTKASDEMSVRTNSVKGRSRFSSGSTIGRDVPEANNRHSNIDGLHRIGSLKLNGMSLADELDYEGEDEDEHQDIISSDALPEEIQYASGRMSQQSYTSDHKAFKLLGLLPKDVEHPGKERGSLEEVESKKSDDTMTGKPILDFQNKSSEAPPKYQDSTTQCSPLQSPTIPSNAVLDMDQTLNGVSLSPIDEKFALVEYDKEWPVMTSAACQTDFERFRTPTPTVTIHSPDGMVLPTETRSMSTQTNDAITPVVEAIAKRSRFDSISVPVIAIHPPGSRPNSSHNGVVLPPRTKNASCQATISISSDSKSVSVQTEAIKIDKRSVKLPPRLPLTPRLTSESGYQRPLISAASLSAESIKLHRPTRKPSSKSLPRKDSIEPVKLRTRSSLDSNASASASNGGFLHKKQSSELRRPVISASLFAGFDDLEATHGTPDNDEKEASSDDDFIKAAPIRKTLSKSQGSWKLIPQTKSPPKSKLLGKGKARASAESRAKTLSAVFETTPDRARNIGEKAAMEHVTNSMGGQLPPKLGLNRQAITSIGSVASLQRSRSPSAPDTAKGEASTVAPPFPVPTRSSSRKIPISASEGAQSPSPYTTSFFANPAKAARPPVKSKNPLRKVRSAATVEKPSHTSDRKVPRPSSPSLRALDSPTVPPTVSSNVSQASSTPIQAPQPTHPFPAASLGAEVIVNSPGQSISVVDAIAQTMVGEWMWKYVRKRKSFGKTENNGTDIDESGTGGVRHKRWVWLAPYERAIMWSSKQPTSGPALLGKSGRKLTIQSALDVKDDTPMPKGSGNPSGFGLSLLIITPTRALKFTATTKERHHTWLTALTFLSHSASAMDDLTNIPPVPRHEYQGPPSRSSSSGLRRSTLRDSIRIAKSRSPRPSFSHAISSPADEMPSLKVQRDPVVSGTGTAEEVPDNDAAEAPHVPRTSSHNRKRSSTGPSGSRPGPHSSSSTGFLSGAAMTSTRSLKTPVTSSAFKDHSAPSIFGRAGGLRPGGSNSNPSTMRRVSENDAAPPPIHPNPHHHGSHGLRNNFFDAVGTVRMEAFVDDSRDLHAFGGGSKERRGGGDMVARRGDGSGRKMPVKGKGKKDLGYWGLGGGDEAPGGGTAAAAAAAAAPAVGGGGRKRRGTRGGSRGEEKWRIDDPFKGF